MPDSLTDLTDLSNAELDYDAANDILCIALGPMMPADHAHKANGIIHRYREGKLIGLTILNLKDRLAEQH